MVDPFLRDKIFKVKIPRRRVKNTRLSFFVFSTKKFEKSPLNN